MISGFSWRVRVRVRVQIGNGGVRNSLPFVVFVQQIADRNEIVEFRGILHDLFENCIDDRWRPGVLSGPYPPPIWGADDLQSRGENCLRRKHGGKWPYRIPGLFTGKNQGDPGQREKQQEHGLEIRSIKPHANVKISGRAPVQFVTLEER